MLFKRMDLLSHMNLPFGIEKVYGMYFSIVNERYNEGDFSRGHIMGRLTLTTCDRCGRWIVDKTKIGYINIGYLADLENKQEAEYEGKEFCPECIKELVLMMESPKRRFTIRADQLEVTEAEEKPPEKKTTGKKAMGRRPIDTGKIMALHRTKWPIEKIAKEMNLSEETITEVITMNTEYDKAGGD